jgi:hypothetical protein
MGEGIVMSIESVRDARNVLVQDKYFSLRPKPLERWLWQQTVAPAAERVFWLHWEEGMRRGDWCSELSLKQVARECCVDMSTVTRAYQQLKDKGLLRREDPGRDPFNPFLQAVAITEVLLPRELLQQLRLMPNRSKRGAAQVADGATHCSAKQADTHVPAGVPERPVGTPAVEPEPSLSRAESAALMSRLSERERAAFFVASRDRSTQMPFDPDTRLTPKDQVRILSLLGRLSADSRSPCAQVTPRKAVIFAARRQVSPLEAARLRKQVGASVGLTAAAEVFRQVLWSVEEGALRRFELRLAINIALKKIREGAWTRPNRMPPNWMRSAVPGTCSAA